LKDIVLSDATANVWKSPPWKNNLYVVHSETSDAATFRGGLASDEPAWKVRAEFSRESGFTSDELWESEPIAIPSEGQTSEQVFLTNWPGVKMYLGFRGKNAQARSIVPPAGHEQLMVSLVSTVSPAPRLTLVKAVDENNRRVAHRLDLDDSEEFSVFGLSLPSEAHYLRFTFALHKSRFVQFLAKPSPRSDQS
jgi:hypothetical protein